MSPLRRLAALFPVLSVLVATPAIAQDDKGPDHVACFERRQYDACFREGKAQYGSESFEQAYDAYLEGWKLKPNYEVAGNLGNVELKLGKYAAAYTHLKYSLENLPPSQRGTAVESTLNEKLQQALQHVGGRRFDTDPSGSQVTIDGEPIDNGPMNLWVGLDPGERKLVVSKEGFTTVERTLDIRAGSEESTSIVLVPKVETDQPEPEGPDTADEGPELILPLVIVGGVVAVAGIGAGIGLHVAASSKADEREALAATIADPGACSGNPTGTTAATCQQLTELADQETTFSNAGTGVLIAGAAVGVAVGVYAIIILTAGDDDEDEDEADRVDEADAASITLVPTLSPTESGMTILGRF